MNITWTEITDYQRATGAPNWHVIASDKPGTPGVLTRSQFEELIRVDLISGVTDIIEERTTRASEQLLISLEIMAPETNGGLTSVFINYGLKGDHDPDGEYDHRFVVDSTPDRIVAFDAEGNFDVDPVELNRVVELISREIYAERSPQVIDIVL